VPTVERDDLTVLVCSIAIDGRMFSIEALRVQGLEDERALAGAAQARDDDVPAEGDV
jgi:hypothetical protein